VGEKRAERAVVRESIPQPVVVIVIVCVALRVRAPQTGAAKRIIDLRP